MKYETPELIGLMPAINAVQNLPKAETIHSDSTSPKDEVEGAYQDWE